MQGTWRADRASKNEWQPPAGAPDCPKTLKGEALAEWRRIVPMLLEANILTLADRSALEEYCEAFKLWHTYARIAEKQPMIRGARKNDPPRANPAVKIALQAMETANRLRANFGLNPSARAKVPAQAPAAEAEEASLFLFGPPRLVLTAAQARNEAGKEILLMAAPNQRPETTES